MAAVATVISNLTGNGEPEELERQQATYNLFKVLGVEPELGRVFTADEDKPGAGRVVVISHGLWKRRFGGERRIIGQTISLDGANHTVIGVMPEGFSFPWKGTDLWLPIGFTAETLASRGNHYLLVVARLRGGVLLSQVNADLQVLLKRILQQDSGLAAAPAAPPTTGLPAGTVTFLLTDIEGSTRRWDRSPAAMREAMEAHDEVVGGLVGAHGGTAPPSESVSRCAYHGSSRRP